MKKLGFVGFRGMVGSVLMKRMREEGDFSNFLTYFYSTTTFGKIAPEVSQGEKVVGDATDLKQLLDMDIILTCQGGEYTKETLKALRDRGWNGFWVDSSSEKRIDDDSIIVLDPINCAEIEDFIISGGKNLIGGNCTVSLMLLALDGLFSEDLVEWVSTMTYQAVSGAGAAGINELVDQHKFSLDKDLSQKNYSTNCLGAKIAYNILPWIDSKMENGQTREEWKGEVEINKILNRKSIIPVDGICVRVPVLRCHSQAMTLKLKKDLKISEIERILDNANEWVSVVKNEKESILDQLTPLAASEKLIIPVGRIKKMSMGENYISLFTVGDQLLWGAAEPLRRVLKLL